MSGEPSNGSLTELRYGFHPVREILRHRPQSVEKVLVSAQGKRVRAVAELARREGVALEQISTEDLERRLAEGGSASVSSAVHNGFAALVRPDNAGDRPAQASAGSGGDSELIVLLEDVQDPRNLGAILRVCDGAGVGRVMVRDRGSAPMSATAVKASAGAAEMVDCERFTNTARELELLKEQGYWCYGADAEGLPPWEIDLRGPVVLCLGGEGTGLRKMTRELCDGLVGLPMRGRVGSLNVATAAAALLYEAVRQRLV